MDRGRKGKAGANPRLDPLVGSLVILAMTLFAVGCAADTEVKPSPSPSSQFIDDTGVPWPPDDYHFSHQNRRDLILGGRFDRYLFFSSLPPDPADLAAKASDLFHYYESAMQAEGWTLFEEAEMSPQDDPDLPPDAVFGGQEWHKDGRGVVIQLSTYQLLGGQGRKLNLMVVVLGQVETEPPSPN